MSEPRDVSTDRAGRTLQLQSCLACGQVCEVTGCFTMPGPDGQEPYMRTRCIVGHILVGPAFALRGTAA